MFERNSPKAAPHNRIAPSSITGTPVRGFPVELSMNPRTSTIAFRCSSGSLSSVNSRTFSMAITA